MALPKSFTAGERLFASDLNGNFTDLNDRQVPVFASGSETLTVVGQTVSTTSITFSSGTFSSAPVVMVSLSFNSNASGSDGLAIFATSVTSSGFTLRVTNNEGPTTSASVAAYWVAIQADAGGALPKTFVSGERLFASDLNDDFEYLDEKMVGPKIASGITGNINVERGKEVNTSITFPSGLFTSAPIVVITPEDRSTFEPAADIAGMGFFVNSVTTSGFTLRATSSNEDISDIKFYWLAVQT
jgi:hypothetical protein